MRSGQDQGEEQGFDREDPVRQCGKEVHDYQASENIKKIFLEHLVEHKKEDLSSIGFIIASIPACFMFLGLVTVSGMGSTTARETSLRFLNKYFLFSFSVSHLGLAQVNDILSSFTLVNFVVLPPISKGSLSLVVPD